MCDLQVCDRVRLIRGVPTLWLCRGDVGIVKSLWLSPMLACEVEFDPTDRQSGVRALLFPDQLEVIYEQHSAARGTD